MVDEEVRRLIDEAHDEAYAILTENRDVLDRLALELLERETLNQARDRRDLPDIRKRDLRDVWLSKETRPVQTSPPVQSAGEKRRSRSPTASRKKPAHARRRAAGRPIADPHVREPAAGGRALPGRRYRMSGPTAPTRLGSHCDYCDRHDDPDPLAVADDGIESNAASVDRPRIEAAVREILMAIGEDPDREGLQDTPKRVAKAYAEVFAGLHQDPADVLGTTFDIDHEELVLVKDIPFYSTCEHHLVPFHGTAHIGYIPSQEGKVTGLSKLARLVEIYARRPQVQERLTTQIVEALVNAPATRAARSSSSNANTCACPCAGSASPAPRPSPRPCAASCATRPPGPRP